MSGPSPLVFRGKTHWTPDFVDWYGAPLKQPHAGQDENHPPLLKINEAVLLGAGRAFYLRELYDRRYDVRVVLSEGDSITDASAGLPSPFQCQRLLKAANGTVFLFGASFPEGTAGIYEPKRLCEVWTIRPPEKGGLPKWKRLWKEDPGRGSDQLKIRPENLEVFGNDLVAKVIARPLNNPSEGPNKTIYKVLRSDSSGRYTWNNLFADETKVWDKPLRCAPGRSYPLFQFEARPDDGLPEMAPNRIPFSHWQLFMQVAVPGKGRTKGLVFEQPVVIATMDLATRGKIDQTSIYPLDAEGKVFILYVHHILKSRELVNGWYQGIAEIGVITERIGNLTRPVTMEYKFNSQFTKEKEIDNIQVFFSKILPIRNNIIYYKSSQNPMYYLPSGASELLRLDSLAHAYIDGFAEQSDRRLGVFVSSYQTKEEETANQRRNLAEAVRSEKQLEESIARNRRRKRKEMVPIGFGLLVFIGALAMGGFTASQIVKGGTSIGRVLIGSMLFLGFAIGGSYLGMLVAFIVAASMGLVGSH